MAPLTTVAHRAPARGDRRKHGPDQHRGDRPAAPLPRRCASSWATPPTSAGLARWGRSWPRRWPASSTPATAVTDTPAPHTSSTIWHSCSKARANCQRLSRTTIKPWLFASECWALTTLKRPSH